MSDRQTQCQRIWELLFSGFGNWVSLPQIMKLGIASHTRRIHELRKAGHIIEKREQYQGHSRHVWYRLVRGG